MKRIGRLIPIAMVLALCGLVYYFYGGGEVPAGQQPLLSINSGNFDRLRTDFNDSRGAVRVITLLSPT